MPKPRATLALAMLLLAMCSSAAMAQLQLQFQYLDAGTGIGFDDPVLGSDRKLALETAAADFATAFAAYDATIILDATGSSPDGSLSFANPAFTSSAASGFGTHEVVRNKALSHGAVDLNGNASDGDIGFNFNIDWELDGTLVPGPMSYDFHSAIYHELTHIMGFSSGIITRGGFFAGDHLGRTTGEWTKFDEYLTDVDLNSLFNGATLDKPRYHPLLVDGASPNGGLFFNGSQGPIGLYTPTTFEAGSSGTHLDDENLTYAGSLMISSLEPGPGPRTFSSVELGILSDIGYSELSQIHSVPEPNSTLLICVAAMPLFWLRQREV